MCAVDRLRSSGLYNTWMLLMREIITFEIGKKNTSADDVLRYFAYQRQCINFPVEVVVSQLIQSSDEYSSIIKTIIKRLVNGDGVAPYLSRGAIKLQPDMLFLDWGIIHLHLVDIKNGKPSRPVPKKTLHVFYKNGIAYLFNFGSHGKGAYTNIADMQFLYDNWPNLFAKLKLHFGDLNTTIKSDNDMNSKRYELRKLGLNPSIRLCENDGSYFYVVAPNFAFTTAGTTLLDRNILEAIHSN